MDFEQQQKAFEYRSFEAIRPLLPSDAQALRCIPFFGQTAARQTLQSRFEGDQSVGPAFDQRHLSLPIPKTGRTRGQG